MKLTEIEAGALSNLPVVKKTKPRSIILQGCPLQQAARQDVGPTDTSLTTKLYSCRQELEKTTTYITRTELIA